MSYPVLAPDAQPCVWMCAGVIRYRLCTRDLDCENCLLDAALRAEYPSLADDPGGAGVRCDGAVPEDRLYGPGHTWMRRGDGDGGIWRVGLDAFGAALLGTPVAVVWRPPGRLARGDPLCHVALGAGFLTLGSPVRARWLRGNPGLPEAPGSLVSSPYGDGWIAELTAVDPTDLRELASPPSAARQLDRDLRRFRRSVAVRLLADPDGLQPDRPPAAGPLTDLGHLLGGERWIELIRDFLH